MTFPSDGGSYIILSPIELSIRRKIEAVGKPLKDWDVQINYGIKTGCNEAFIITTEKRDELLAQCQTEEERQRTAELIRPILRGRDIKRYSYDWAGLWVICARLCEEIPTNYPTICHHLESFIGKGKLGDNSTTKVFERPWWSWMQEPSYWKDFDGPKIVWNRIAAVKQFALINEHMFIQDSMHFIIGEKLLYLCSVLNSKIIQWLLSTIIGAAAGGNAGNADNIWELPLPLCSEDTMIDDNTLYSIYQLSEEEIYFIESL